MNKIQVERTVPAPPNKAWEVLRSFRLDYFAGYPHSVTGEGVGAERSFQLPDGEMTERVTAFDPEGMQLSYEIVHGPWPVRNYLATVQVTPAEEGSTITWSATYEPDGVDAEAAAELVSGTFKMNLRAIEKYLSA